MRWLLPLALATCATPRQLRVFPADKTYAEQCPAIDIDLHEYVQIEVLESHHHEATQLVSVGDDARVADVTFNLCHPQTAQLVCLGSKVFRRLGGAPMIAEPFCKDDKCDLGFALWVVAPDGSIRRWNNCRLAGGMMIFEDPEDPNSSVRMRCMVKDKLDNSVQPRDCYPPY